MTEQTIPARQLCGDHLLEEIRVEVTIGGAAAISAIVTAELRQVYHTTTSTDLTLTGIDDIGTGNWEITVERDTPVTILP